MPLPDYATYAPSKDLWTIYGIEYTGYAFQALAKALETGRLILCKDKETSRVFVQPQQPQLSQQVSS